MAADKQSDDPIAREVAKLDLSWRFRSPYLWGLGFAIVSVLGFFLFPIASNDWGSWNPGPLHSGHAMLTQDCAACHSAPFQKISDNQCLACHKISAHGAEATPQRSLHNETHLNAMKCVDCHVEHRGESAFVPKESELCSSCHADLSKTIANPGYDSFDSFANHTEFAINQGKERVRLSDAARLKDPNTLDFNHAIHLKVGLKGAKGRVNLGCEECHQFDSGQRQSKPITFEQNCRSCHELSFDDRLPDSRVPHKDPNTVYNFLISEYSKFLGVPQSEITKAQASEKRAIPGKDNKEKAQSQNVAVSSVLTEARKSEQLLFTKTSCQLCHDVSERTTKDPWVSYFEIEKPIITSPWLPHSTFLHSAHAIASCESCHGTVRDSEKTADLLLPGIKDCRSCHVDEGHTGLVPSNCSTCHQYHFSQSLETEKQRAIEDLVKLGR